MKHTMPTMKDVAREAGVALGTVSRVFSGQAVGEEYRIRVEQAAQKLNYQVNTYARGLKTNQTKIIAVILPNVTNPYFAALAQDLNLALARTGYQMMLFLTDMDQNREAACIQMVRQNKVDGIIGLTYGKIEVYPDVTYVSIDRYFGSGIPCVASDNYGGGCMAAEKLYQNGCRSLLFLRNGSAILGEPDKRQEGFRRTCLNLNLSYEELNLTDSPDYAPFYDFLRSHMEGGILKYDGIFCDTDHLAIQICKFLREMNLKIPQDVQVIGFDGIREMMSDQFYCSTIVQSTRQIAETCVDIATRSKRSENPTLVCLPVNYGFGGTTRF